MHKSFVPACELCGIDLHPTSWLRDCRGCGDAHDICGECAEGCRLTDGVLEICPDAVRVADAVMKDESDPDA